eukprot:CAMPEP_0202038184 /NCGR_PEP_ID=MMETSP0962-20130828/7355_1 /ASSEMBLY_ACC=CAM_ASM_000488 /TAXON_ID=4773 /ORGANISM="Schizochytrium aggregatum, Strain ATCC28209" /LENGTH=178 /DNA_ID=CAMNT_0048602333 /DNA_START=22 /DNA_END=558 /DNA_ORIENTATION=+
MDRDQAEERQREARAQIAARLAQGIEYECGDCARTVRLRPGDQVICHECGYRILYKPRTKRPQQYEAAEEEAARRCATLTPDAAGEFCPLRQGARLPAAVHRQLTTRLSSRRSFLSLMMLSDLEHALCRAAEATLRDQRIWLGQVAHPEPSNRQAEDAAALISAQVQTLIVGFQARRG